jgi:glycerophosphoryl diester phosphodiesterase
LALAHTVQLPRLPLIIGHRGSSAVAPENTLAAFQQSILEGADGVEFDVRLARDNIPVVIHDATLSRIALIADIHKLGTDHVSRLSSTEIAAVDVSRPLRRHYIKTDSEHAIKVPILESVFKLFAVAKGQLYLEMKGEPVSERLVQEVVKLIDAYSFHNRVVVESFDHEALRFVRLLAPLIRTAPLFERHLRSGLLALSPRRILQRARETSATEVALHYRLAKESAVRLLREAGFEVVVWTVDDTQWVSRAKKFGIKALITNDPALLLRSRDSLVV